MVPVRPEFVDLAKNAAAELSELQIRTDIDDRDESVDKRVRDAELNWIPYILVVGKREVSMKVFPVRRRRDGKQYEATLEELGKEIVSSTNGYPRMPLKLPELLSKRPGYRQIS